MSDEETKRREERNRKDLYRLIVALSDIGNAEILSEFIVKNISVNNPLWVPLQDATIISYARPFTENEPYGPLPKKWSKFESEDMKRLHNELIELRHQTIAHSDATVRHVYVFPPGTSPDAIQTKGVTFAARTIKEPPERFTEIAELCQYVGTRIHDEVQSRIRSIPDEFGIHDAPFDLLTGDRVKFEPD